jgi:uncharacterized DUF497 family protein
MQFEWDPDKNRANLTKHGIDFALAALVFADPHVTLREDRVDEARERRWHALGLAAGVGADAVGRSCLQGGKRWRRNHPHHLGQKSSSE